MTSFWWIYIVLTSSASVFYAGDALLGSWTKDHKVMGLVAVIWSVNHRPTSTSFAMGVLWKMFPFHNFSFFLFLTKEFFSCSLERTKYLWFLINLKFIVHAVGTFFLIDHSPSLMGRSVGPINEGEWLFFQESQICEC